MISFFLRFAIFFTMSFFLLSLPIGGHAVFYYLHDHLGDAIVSATGNNKYIPTYRAQKKVSSAKSVKKPSSESKAIDAQELDSLYDEAVSVQESTVRR
jgi:hypothetical protein